MQTLIRPVHQERLANPAQLKLQQQYDKGEINLKSLNPKWKQSRQLDKVFSFIMGQSFHILLTAVYAFNRWRFEMKRKERRDYRNDYSIQTHGSVKDICTKAGQLEMFIGAKATQVHHKKYAKLILKRTN